MWEDDGRKVHHQTLEVLRLRVVEQVAWGVPAAEVGAGLATLGPHRRTIYIWLAKERTQGWAALRARPVPGRAGKLADVQLGELAGLIAESDPRDHGFAVALWTRQIVRQLIAARFGVQLPVARRTPCTTWAFPRSVALPGRAGQPGRGSPKEVAYPKIAAQAKAAGGMVGFVDEAGMPSDYHAGTTWPGLARRRRCDHRRSVQPEHDLGDQRQGTLRFSVLTGTLTAAGFIAFQAAAARRRAQRQRPGVLHRRQSSGAPGQGGDRFVDSTDGALRFYRLAYSLQLNPDESVWKNVKHDRVAPPPRRDPSK